MRKGKEKGDHKDKTMEKKGEKTREEKKRWVNLKEKISRKGKKVLRGKIQERIVDGPDSRRKASKIFNH